MSMGYKIVAKCIMLYTNKLNMKILLEGKKIHYNIKNILLLTIIL